jgi:lipoprotein-releasing system permease protein
LVSDLNRGSIRLMTLSWLLFRNYLLSRRSGALVRIIAWHCILGIGMGVAALIIVLSVMEGFNRTIRTRMLSVEPHLVLSQKAHPTETQAQDLQRLVESVTQGGVEQIDRFETQDLILRSVDGVFGGVVAKGLDSGAINSLLKRMWMISPQETAAPQVETSDLEADEVILGVDLARSLGIFEGDEVLLISPETLLLPKGEAPKFQKFRVRSLVSTQMPEFDSKLLFYNLDKFNRRMRSASRESGFEIRLKNAHEADAVKAKLKDKGVNVQTWGDRDTSLFFALKMESLAMTLFLSLAVLITSFSIVIVMVLLMSQKRKDIGLLMAIGMSVWRARLLFLRVGLLLSFLGILGGIVLGTTVALILDWYPMELLPDIYTDATLPAKLTTRIFLFVTISSSLIAIFGSWLPVWRYVAHNPSEALRKPAA